MWRGLLFFVILCNLEQSNRVCYGSIPSSSVPVDQLGFAKPEILSHYYSKNAPRLLVFDNDGVLKPKGETTAEEINRAKKMLTKLTEDINNDVWIVSARSLDGLDDYRHIPRLNIAAEHGTVLLRYDNSRATITPIAGVKDLRSKIFHMVKEKGLDFSFKNVENSVVFTYKNYQHDHVAEFIEKLEKLVSKNYPEFIFRNIRNPNVVEVKSRNVDKGSFVKEVILQKKYNFGLSMGDEEIDEGMHKVMNEMNSEKFHSVIVSGNGSQKTCAKWRVENPKDVYELVSKM